MIQFRDRGAHGRHRGAMVDAYDSFSSATRGNRSPAAMQSTVRYGSGRTRIFR